MDRAFHKIRAFPILTAFLLTAVEIFCKTLRGNTYLLIHSNLLDAIVGAFLLVLSRSAFIFRSLLIELSSIGQMDRPVLFMYANRFKVIVTGF